MEEKSNEEWAFCDTLLIIFVLLYGNSTHIDNTYTSTLITE